MATKQTSVGAYDAKTRFAELLQRVSQGEEITITRHGTPVARLVPARRMNTPEGRARAIREMREIASRNRLAGLKVKDLRDEGRR